MLVAEELEVQTVRKN